MFFFVQWGFMRVMGDFIVISIFCHIFKREIINILFLVGNFVPLLIDWMWLTSVSLICFKTTLGFIIFGFGFIFSHQIQGKYAFMYGQ